MLKPKDPIASKKSAAKKIASKKSRLKVRDLTPRKNPNGGSGLYPKEPSLSIPPQGFMSENAEGKEDK
ncbi:MAG: hypothetical protein ACXV97_00015 [Chthoniobacterales bacterium]